MGTRARTTVSVDFEVLEVYRRLAEAGRVSLSKCIGDWLESTAEGAGHVAEQLYSVRSSPGRAMRELHLDMDILAAEHTSDYEHRQDAPGLRAERPQARPVSTISPLPVIRGESTPPKAEKRFRAPGPITPRKKRV